MTDFESKMTNFIFKTNFWKYRDDHFWPENDNEMTNGSWFRLKIVIFNSYFENSFYLSYASFRGCFWPEIVCFEQFLNIWKHKL